MSKRSIARPRTTDSCIRTITILETTIEIIKSWGFIGVTNNLFKIPLRLYSTILKPLPAILRFMSIKASNPGNKKST